MLIKKVKKLPPELTEENLKRYVSDRMAFRLEQFVMPPSVEMPQGGLFGEVCQDWQKEYIFKPLDSRTSDGFPTYKLLYIQLPKKLGKTQLMAGESIVQLVLSPFPDEENYILGGDKEQAAYLLKKIKEFISMNPNFTDLFEVYKNEIGIKSTGARIEILSSEADTKQGKSPSFFIFDEFWNQPDRDLYDVFFLGMSAKPYAQGVILTNAGFDIKSICYEVRNLCKSGEFKEFYHFEPTGTLLDSLEVPWITPQWLDIERRSTPTKVFNRFRKNIWVVEGENPFMPDEGWDCFKLYLLEKSFCNQTKHYLGIDLGLKKDAAAVVMVHREGKKLKVDLIRRWLGSSEVPVKISDIEEFLINCLKNFSEVTLIVDPWQLMGTIQRFKAVGTPVIEYYLTIQNISKLSKNLFYLLKNVELEIPDHTKLKDELKGMQVVEKSYGWRIDHAADNTSDITMALGMACVEAMEHGLDEYNDRDLADLGFLDQNQIYRVGGRRDYVQQIKSPRDLTDESSGDTMKIHTGKRVF